MQEQHSQHGPLLGRPKVGRGPVGHDLEQYAGSVPKAAELLAAAAELADGAQRVWALAELGNTRFRLNDLAGVGEVADRLAEAADPATPGSGPWPPSRAGSPSRSAATRPPAVRC
jgi:hypothetical protein